MIKFKVQLVILAYNGDFQNKMHRILGTLKLEFNMPLLVWNLSSCIGLDYYTTNNNTCIDIIINNLTKLYNITCTCSFTQDYILKTKPQFYFRKNLQRSRTKTKKINLQE